ncbi:MAG: VOC family protein, partial [Solirubrobacteraceae bacterium]
MTARPRLDHCVIAVSDWERATAFYRDVLGAEIVELPYGRRAFGLANAQLNVHGPGSTPQPRAAHPVVPGNSDVCFEWSGPIAAATAHLQRCDVEVIEGPVER